MTATSAPNVLNRSWSRATRCCCAAVCRVGVITTKQWQAIDKFAGENTIYGSIRLTNRQTFQFHGILKKNVKPVHQMLHSVGLDALATANDMNRNVLCTSNPYESQLHAEAYEWAKKISEHLLPRTRAYAEIWLDQEKVATTDEEPILVPDLPAA